MSIGKLASSGAIALLVIFVVFLVALAGELLYVFWRHRSFRLRSSPLPPICSGNETPNFSTTDAATKELLYFFCLKPHTRVELDPPGAPNKNTDESSPDEQVVDVFKLSEANGPSRFLCTIKEEDKEEVESMPDVDFLNKSKTKKDSLQSCLQLVGEPAVVEVEEEVAVTVDQDDGNTKTVFSTPYDSPLFFTPVGSPSRDFMESEFVVSINETRNSDDR